MENQKKLTVVIPLLSTNNQHKRRRWNRIIPIIFSLIAITIICLSLRGKIESAKLKITKNYTEIIRTQDADVVESTEAVVAADDGRCSEIGILVLKSRGHAVDAAVATALCEGVVNPMASGIGGGAFMIVRSSKTLKTQAFDMRETAPAAASQNMYDNDPHTKYSGALSVGIPGEIAGLHKAWSEYGRLPWKTLFQPAIKLAKEGFVVSPYLGHTISETTDKISNDPGLRRVFAPNGKFLQAGDTCYNVELGRSLEAIAEGPEAFYNGRIGEKFVEDVRKAGGILTVDDLRNYRVNVTEAMAVNAMGFTILGMPPPSSGTLGLSLVLKVLESYGSIEAVKGALGLHRLIEAMKHMFAVRMNLGDPDFVNITNTISEMLSPSFAKKIQQRIFDNTTFPSNYYMPRWSQLQDRGTSHFCIVDSERNAVSMTTTVNYAFGAGILSPLTGIVVNNEMDDFSTPSETSPDSLPPAPNNFIAPDKRPLSSMTPIIVLKDNQLVGVLGGSGGMKIIPAVLQVFLNHFVLGMKPLDAVQSPRVYHKLIPNTVLYENWTVLDGDHIELSEERKSFLKARNHELKAQSSGAICQLVVQTLVDPNIDFGRKTGRLKDQVLYGTLIAVSDPRKDGRPASM